MKLPSDLQRALDNAFEDLSVRRLSKSARGLRERYRLPGNAFSSRFIESEEDALAYAGVRFAATYAVVHFVLEELRTRRPDFRPQSLLDVGAGLASGAWAASRIWSDLDRITLLEGDRKMISLGQRILSQASSPALRGARYELADLTKTWSVYPHDLVIASYVVRELPEPERRAFVDRLWQATADSLCCIEPGKSPQGYLIVRSARDQLAKAGGAVLAPCSQLRGCATKDGQWCHFAQRVERSKTHRQLKLAFRPYEDEKFSYVIVARHAGVLVEGRIAFPPRRTGAGIILEVCTGDSLKRLLVPRQDKDLYRWVRRAWWGDAVPPGLLNLDGAAAEAQPDAKPES